MRDVIDERNEKERISKSIIKYWNVNYIMNQTQQTGTVAAHEQDTAEEEGANRQEEADEEDREVYYNIATGSYSGEYGREEVKDEVTKGQINKILHEKSEALRELIENTDEECNENE